MTLILLSNVGSRDVSFEGEFCQSCQRSKAKEFLQGLEEDFELYKSVLKFPIIDPLIAQLKEIDLLVLFATDQHPEKTEEKYRNKDTINSAKLIKKVIEYDSKLNEMVKRVKIMPVVLSPNDYDEMFKEYQTLFDELHKYLKEIGLDHSDEACLNLTGGTPACNLALMYTGLHDTRLGLKQCVYCSESASDNPVKYLELSTVIKKQQMVEIANQLLQTYNYRALLNLVDQLIPSDRILKTALRSLHSRKNFQFQEAIREIAKAGESLVGGPWQMLRTLKTWLQRVQSGIDDNSQQEPIDQMTMGTKAVIEELFWNAKIVYEAGDYVGFLGRFFRLQELLLRIKTEQKVGVSTRVSRLNQLQQYVNDDYKLRSYLISHKVSFERPSRALFYCLLKWILPDNDRFIDWVERGGVWRDDGLVSYRNRSILGHEFEGVDRELIETLWNGDILRDTENLLKSYFDIALESSEVREIHQWILNRITRFK